MIEIKNHPAMGKDVAGNLSPLFPKAAAIYYDGILIAYVSEENSVSFIKPINRITEAVRDEALELVKAERGPVGETRAVPNDPPQIEEDESPIWQPGDLDE
jgi:hypothetical protein